MPDVHATRGGGDHDPPGLDLSRLTSWFVTNVPDAGPDLRAELIEGGKSNLTYRASDDADTWIVRRPPLGHVLDSAHDMGREYRVMSALAQTHVPVPRAIAMCEDTDVIGAPFYVMECVPGTPYRHASELVGLGEVRTRNISERFVQTLAELSMVDPASIDLEDFGRPHGFLARQLRRWHRRLEASRFRDLPAANRLHEALTGSVPAESSSGLVHGDFRLDNVLFDADDVPRAVIDWEMATLGDPITDLALMVVYQRLGSILGEHWAGATSAAGYLGEDEVLEAYVTATGRDVPHLGWYLGLASYKLAAILEGIHHRHAQGMTVGPGFDGVGAAVQPLLESGIASLSESV